MDREDPAVGARRNPSSAAISRAPTETPWWREHLVWVLGGVPVGLAFTRVFVTARFGRETAAAIFARSNTLEILAGVFFAAVPTVVPFVAFLAWTQYRASADGSLPRNAFGALAISVGMVAVLATPIFVLGAWGVVALIAAVQRDPPAEGVSWPSWITYVTLGLLVTYTVASEAMWLPPEIVSQAKGPDVAGYVLEDDGRWMTVLRESDRGITALRSDDVVAREVCRTSPSFIWARTAVELLDPARAAAYPMCADP